MEKREARRQIAEAVRRLTPEERTRKSAAIAENVLSLPEVKAARTVMAFLPLPDEIDTRPLISALLGEEKRLCVPRTILRDKSMYPVRLKDMESLQIGDYGIPEPSGDERCGPNIDVIIIPGRAFDANGNRLGRGAGYYDRFLMQVSVRAMLCGICFDCQVIKEVPTDNTDIPVGIVVTENRILRR